MLGLTDKFIESLNMKIDNELRIRKQGHGINIYIMLDTNIAEVYKLHNNGVEAQWMYQGLHNVTQQEGNK